MQWRNRTVAILKCIATIEIAGPQSWYCLLMLLGKLQLKLQKFITYSYNIQIIHILVRWNPPENGEKTHEIFFNFNNSK
jgi:hypothetical protein